MSEHGENFVNGCKTAGYVKLVLHENVRNYPEDVSAYWKINKCVVLLSH